MGFVEGPTEMTLPQHSQAFHRHMKIERLLKVPGGPEALAKVLLRKRREKLSECERQNCEPNTAGAVEWKDSPAAPRLNTSHL